MSTLLVTHPACLDHLMPAGHPERPDRLRAIDRVLEHERFQDLMRVEAPAASLETIALILILWRKSQENWHDLTQPRFRLSGCWNSLATCALRSSADFQ
jgi:acetoin utilization deacetylase AcuC-like enzyme